MEAPFRMPLDADNKSSGRIFNRLDHTVRRRRDNPQVPAGLGHGLMVETVHFDRLRACKARQQTILYQSDCVARRLFGLAAIVMKCGSGYYGRNILHQFPTAKDVETLRAETDSQYGQLRVISVLKQRKIHGIAFGKHLAQFGVRRLSENRGVDIRRASRKQEAVDAFQIFRCDLRRRKGGNDDGKAASPKYRVEIPADRVNRFSRCRPTART
jgi:hypothetical protein